MIHAILRTIESQLRPNPRFEWTIYFDWNASLERESLGDSMYIVQNIVHCTLVRVEREILREQRTLRTGWLA